MLHRIALSSVMAVALGGCVISPGGTIAAVSAQVGVVSKPGVPMAGAPIIDALQADPREIGPNDTVTFTAVAHDPAGRPLQFNWSATGGVLSTTTGKVVSWQPMGAKGVVVVSLTVTNGVDATTGSVNLQMGADGSAVVTATPTPAPTAAPTATPTAAPTPVPVATATAAPACEVASIAPSLAAPGTLFYIGGAHFPTGAAVTLGGKPAKVVEAKETSLAVQVPADMPLGKAKVAVAGCGDAGELTVANTQDFGGNVQQAGQGLFANVYPLPPNTPKLPDLDQLNATSSLLVNNLDVPDHDFKLGFPGVTGDLVEWFAIRFDGMIEVPAGETAYRITSDDGAKLYLDDQLVVDNDGTHAIASKDGKASLAAGKHKFRLDYFQGPRYRIALQLLWTPPGAKEPVIVPASAFSQGAFKR